VKFRVEGGGKVGAKRSRLKGKQKRGGKRGKVSGQKTTRSNSPFPLKKKTRKERGPRQRWTERKAGGKEKERREDYLVRVKKRGNWPEVGQSQLSSPGGARKIGTTDRTDGNDSQQTR